MDELSPSKVPCDSHQEESHGSENLIEKKMKSELSNYFRSIEVVNYKNEDKILIGFFDSVDDTDVAEFIFELLSMIASGDEKSFFFANDWFSSKKESDCKILNYKMKNTRLSDFEGVIPKYIITELKHNRISNDMIQFISVQGDFVIFGKGDIDKIYNYISSTVMENIEDLRDFIVDSDFNFMSFTDNYVFEFYFNKNIEFKNRIPQIIKLFLPQYI